MKYHVRFFADFTVEAENTIDAQDKALIELVKDPAPFKAVLRVFPDGVKAVMGAKEARENGEF